MISEYWWKVGKGFLIAAAAGALTYTSTTFIPELAKQPGTLTLVLVPLLSSAVNALQKLVFDPK